MIYSDLKEVKWTVPYYTATIPVVMEIVNILIYL